MSKKNEGFMVLDRDFHIAFCTFKGVQLTPFVDPPRRVKFKGRKEEIAEALAVLTSNPSVPILDFLSHLSAVRSVIFTLKDQGTHNGLD